MDTKITKKRLNDHLSYDWVKYVALIAATIFLFWFLYDVGATKPSMAQTLDIYLLNGASISEETGAKFKEDLQDLMTGKSIQDDRGRDVHTKDEVLQVLFSDYSAYSSDSNTQQAVSVKLMGGGESDLMIMDYGTFINFSQTWLISLDEYLKEVGNKLAEKSDVIGNLTDYPDVPNGSADVAGLERMKERQLWENVRAEYEKLLPRLEQYGYKHNKLKSEAFVDEWRKISDDFKKATSGLSGDKPEDVEKYNAAKKVFDEAYADIVARGGEGEKTWGLDINKFDMTLVKTNWFNATSSYKRQFGDTEDTGFYFAMGVSIFKKNNGDSYYQLPAVFNYVIDHYAAKA